MIMPLGPAFTLMVTCLLEPVIVILRVSAYGLIR